MIRKLPASILYIGNYLSRKGFTPTGMETLGPLLELEGYTMYYASDKVSPILRLLHMLQSILRLRRKAQIVFIDVYSTSNFYYAYVAANLCKWVNIPYITILRGGNLPTRIKGSPAKANSIFKNSRFNIAVSGYIQQAMLESGYSVELIPNSIMLARYPHQTGKVSGALLWVRSFHKTYNPQMAIRLIAALAEKHPGVSLTMVGPDKDGSLLACRKLAEELDIADKITFTGMLAKDEWIRLAANHDVFINTTNFDNMPISVIEAMAMGLPVVSTNVGGIPFLITNYINGILVDKNDVTAMCNSIEYLMQHDEMVSKLTEQARLTTENFDWNVVKLKWINILNQVKLNNAV